MEIEIDFKSGNAVDGAVHMARGRELGDRSTSTGTCTGVFNFVKARNFMLSSDAQYRVLQVQREAYFPDCQ